MTINPETLAERREYAIELIRQGYTTSHLTKMVKERFGQGISQEWVLKKYHEHHGTTRGAAQSPTLPKNKNRKARPAMAKTKPLSIDTTAQTLDAALRAVIALMRRDNIHCLSVCVDGTVELQSKTTRKI